MTQDGERWLVRQGGPDRLWDRIEDHVGRWQRDGSPGLQRFLISVSPEDQSILWSS